MLSRRSYKFLAISIGLAISKSTLAVGIGDIVVNSYVNEPLSAQISVLDPQGLSESEVIASLASLEDFERLGIERHYTLGSLIFDTNMSGAQTSAISVTTENPVREPYLNFLVELKWPEGRVLREYTVFLDLRARQQVDPPTPTSGPVGLQRLNDGLTPSEYRVAPNDTLYSIAGRFRGEGVTIAQVMLAIKDVNPGKFLRDNINGIRAGELLEIPSTFDQSLSAIDAASRVVDEVDEWTSPTASGGLRIVADNEIEVFEDASLESVLGVETPVVNDSTARVASASTESGFSPTSDRRGAGDNGLATIGARLTTLSDQLNQIQDVVASKDQEIASLKAELAKRPVAKTVEALPTFETTAASVQSTLSNNGVLWGLLTVVFAASAYIVRRRFRGREDGVSDTVSAQPLGDFETSLDDLLPVPSQSQPIREPIDVDSSKGYGEPLLTSYASDQSLADAIAEADIYVGYGRHQHALDTLEAASAAEPANASGLLKMFDIYLSLDRIEEAQNLLNKIESTGDPEAVAIAAEKLSSINDVLRGSSSSETLFTELDIAGSDEPNELDLSLDLEFQEATHSDTSPSDVRDASGILDTDEDPAETALDLARAYIDMADKTGAKDLLETAISIGDEAQVELAQQLLASID